MKCLFNNYRISASDFDSRFLKANLSWSPTRTKFCQLIASSSDVLPQLNLTNLKLEYLKFSF